MVAELCSGSSEPQRSSASSPFCAMSFAAANAAAAAAAAATGQFEQGGAPWMTPPASPRGGPARFMMAGAAETPAQLAWNRMMEARVDATDTAVNGVSLNLGATIEHAKVAMDGIVQGVRFELLGSQAKDRVLLEQLNALVAATAAKFTEVETVVNKVVHDVVLQVAAMDQRTTDLTAQLAQRTIQLEHMLAGLAASSATPPARAGGFMANAGVDPGHDAWAAAAAKSQAAAAAMLSQPPGMAQPMPTAGAGAWLSPAAGAAGAVAASAQYYGLGTPQSGRGFGREPRDFRVDYRSWGNHGVLDTKTAPAAYLTCR